MNIQFKTNPTDEEWLTDFEVAIKHSINSALYKKRCEETGFDGTLTSYDDLSKVPYLADWEFKLSNKHHPNLISVSKQDIAMYTLSSSTSGDPSFVPRTRNDVEICQQNYLGGILGWANGQTEETAFLGPPIDILLKKAVKKHNESEAKPFVMMMFQGLKNTSGFGSINFYYDIKKDNGHVYFEKNIKRFIDHMKRMEKENKNVLIVGTTIPTYDFLSTLDKENISFSGDITPTIAVGTGGWDGHKGTNKTDPISKKHFFTLANNLFGVKTFYDGYATSESPAYFHGEYHPTIEDVIHQPRRYMRIIARDLETGAVIKQKNELGLLQIMTPYGTQGSPQCNILTSDIVQVLDVDNVGLISKFIYKKRAKDKALNDVDKGGCGDFLKNHIKPSSANKRSE